MVKITYYDDQFETVCANALKEKRSHLFDFIASMEYCAKDQPMKYVGGYFTVKDGIVQCALDGSMFDLLSAWVLRFECLCFAKAINAHGVVFNTDIRRPKMCFPSSSVTIDSCYGVVELSDEEKAIAQRHLDNFMQEEEAFLVAERKFVDADPYSLIHGKTPVEALALLKDLRKKIIHG